MEKWADGILFKDGELLESSVAMVKSSSEAKVCCSSPILSASSDYGSDRPDIERSDKLVNN